MKKRIFNLLILDESGSMSYIERAAVSGVNETLQTIRSAQMEGENQEHFVTLVTFNTDRIKTVFESLPIAQVHDLQERQYNPDGGTPLYDAVGMSLTKLRKTVQEGDRVLVTIITDGMENASKEYTAVSLHTMIDVLKSKGWVFVYIGANQDAEQVGATLNIHNTMNFEYSDRGARDMSRRTNERRRACYSRMEENDFDARSYDESFFNKDTDL